MAQNGFEWATHEPIGLGPAWFSNGTKWTFGDIADGCPEFQVTGGGGLAVARYEFFQRQINGWFAPRLNEWMDTTRVIGPDRVAHRRMLAQFIRMTAWFTDWSVFPAGRNQSKEPIRAVVMRAWNLLQSTRVQA